MSFLPHSCHAFTWELSFLFLHNEYKLRLHGPRSRGEMLPPISWEHEAWYYTLHLIIKHHVQGMRLHCQRDVAVIFR